MTDLGVVRSPNRPPRVIAHRGFAGRDPENTAAALSAAAPDCDAVEFDVRPTGDGDPVVVHDARLDDLTDASGLVGETATADVVAAEVLGSGETVPRLADVVAAVPVDTALDVELKPPEAVGPRPDGADRDLLSPGEREAARERWQPFVDRVAAALAEGSHEVLYSSFREGALAAVRERGDAAVAPLAATDGEWALDAAARYDAAAIHPAADRLFDGTDLLARAHDADFAVNAWTVRTRRRAERLRDAGVDGLIADVPGLVPPGR